MSSEDKVSTGLFIPIRRRSRASSEETVSTSKLLTTSMTSNTSSSLTSTTTLPRGRTADIKTTRNSSIFIPSSGVRYAVSDRSNGALSYNYPNSLTATNTKTAGKLGGVRDRQRPMRPTSLVDSEHESMRDFIHYAEIDATRTSSDYSSRAPRPQHTGPGTPNMQTAPVKTEPPSPLPGAGQAFEKSRQDDTGMSSTRPIAHFATTTAGSFEHAYPSSPKSSMRTHSPESSHSSRDRTYPPGSFPDSFYQSRTPSFEGSGNPAKTTGRPMGMLKRQSNRSVYTISNSSVSSSENRAPQSDFVGASNFAERPSPAFKHSRLERSTSERVVARTKKAPGVTSPNLSRSLSNSSQHSMFHGTIHHYEGCVHTCPPTTRPLDVQPVITYQRGYASGLSAYSVIRGSCFDCDTSSRRDAETQILLRHAPELSNLIAQTRQLLTELETEDPTVIVQDKYVTDLNTVRNRDEDIITESFELQIRDLEARIQQLTDLRDREVKTIWRGYTARWGPGTLGVVKNPSNARSTLSFEASTSTIQTIPTTPGGHSNRTTYTHRRDRSRDSTGSRTTNTTTTTMYREGETPEGRMRVNWIRD